MNVRGWAAPLALATLLLPLAAFGLLKAVPAWDPFLPNNELHFWVVSGTALAATFACVVVVASARTLRETRLLFLTLAFMSIGGTFSVHGLMTPGHLAHGFYSSLPVSAWLSVVFGSIFVALSAFEMPARVEAGLRRGGVVIFGWAVVLVGAYVTLSFAYEGWLDWVPSDERSVQYVLAALAFVLYAFAAHRYGQAYAFARLPSQGATAGALVLLCQVPPIILWGETLYLSWWIYHVVYAAAITVLFAGWAVEARRAGSLKVIAEALSMRDALAQLDRGHDAHLLELVDAVEAKDVATLGHVRRVSSYALAIGKKLGLPAAELRSLALAGEMHDVGKIGVPDAILTKPGPLTADEYTEMRKHTGRGFDIARRVDTLRGIAPVIRAHHERYDGSGYPDGLEGDAIPLMARIIAVADAYDAMTSVRPYRAALTHAEAVAELRRVRGIEFDPRCVDAFLASFQESRSAAA
jgi:HD-GYP domain-containing protein (c-di-GMP phosphodiesterase class II)